MATTAQPSLNRVHGELAAQLHPELLREQFVARMKAYAKGQGRSFPRSYEVFALRMIMLMVSTPKRGFQVNIFDLVPESLPEENKGLRATPERFFASIEGFDLLERIKGIPHVRRESYRLRPEFEDQFRYGAVERKVRASKGRRAKAHLAVLGHRPLSSKAAFCGGTGESMPSADSQGPRHYRQPGSAGSSRRTQKIQKPRVTHQQYKQARKTVALPTVSDVFEPYVSKILTILEGIPGRTLLVPRSALALVSKTEFSPEEFLVILDGAAKTALVEAPDHQREWVLACLSHPDWAKKFLPKPAVEEVPAEAQPAAIPTIIADVTTKLLGMFRWLNAPGMRAYAPKIAKVLEENGGIDFLPYLVEKGWKSYLLKEGRGTINEKTGGYFLAILGNPHPHILDSARKKYKHNPNAHRDYWKPDNEKLNSYPEKLQELIRLAPEAKDLYDELLSLKATCPAPDSPGFLDHFDKERKVFKNFVAVGEVNLDASVAESLRNDLRNRLTDAKLQEDTLPWRRAWDHHWSRIVCENWGITPEGIAFQPSSTPVEEHPINVRDPWNCEVWSPEKDEEAEATPQNAEPEPMEPDQKQEPQQEPEQWDPCSPEALDLGREVLASILNRIESSPKSGAAKVLRQAVNLTAPLAYQPQKRLVLSLVGCGEELAREYRRRYVPTAREAAKSLGWPDLEIEFRLDRAKRSLR